MFEKEAEEFERRKHYRYEDNDYCGDIADGIIQAYQQGAEFGYNKANEELKEKVSYLEDNLRVARKDRKNLQLEVGKGLKEFIKDCPYSALELYANEYYAEQLTKAKEIIKDYMTIVKGSHSTVCGVPEENRCINILKLNEQAKEFLKERTK